MNILAVEPYYGGSHKAFLDAWIRRSRHTWKLVTLPANKWKWRMRHGAATLSAEVAMDAVNGEKWDALWCSDMLNLAEFRGLLPKTVRMLPSVAYFHENQLTYPVEHQKEYDYHFAFSNMMTGLAADKVWFNSEFHRDSFLGKLSEFLQRMPDYQPLYAVETIRGKTHIRPPGIESFPGREKRRDGPLRILWAARWEYDKAPEVFFEAIDVVAARGVDFRVSVIGGGNRRNAPAVFGRYRERLSDKILHWGYLEEEDYLTALLQSDVVVSTAKHEFFGIGIVEAVAAGVYPLLPRRLAYPEVFAKTEAAGVDSFFYDDASGLPSRLAELAGRVERGELWQGLPRRGIEAVAKYAWDTLAPNYDDDIAAILP